MEDTMMNRILSVSAIALLSITPALAIAPNCETQLAQIQVQLDQQKVKTEALTAKVRASRAVMCRAAGNGITEISPRNTPGNGAIRVNKRWHQRHNDQF
jgi:hypothetical protein